MFVLVLTNTVEIRHHVTFSALFVPVFYKLVNRYMHQSGTFVNNLIYVYIERYCIEHCNNMGIT